MTAFFHSRAGRLADAITESWLGLPVLTVAAAAWHRATDWRRA